MQNQPPSEVLGFLRNGEASYQSRGAEHGENQIFDLGSVTKIVSTTALTMKAIEYDLLSLNDPVQKFFSDFTNSDISIADLLSHRAGLWEWWPLYFETHNRADAIQYILQKSFRYPPRSARHYSDFGFILMGEILSQAFAKDLNYIFKEEISHPLQLNSTSYATPVDVSRCATSSIGDRAEFKMIESNNPYPIDKKTQEFHNWRIHELRGEINDGNAFHVLDGVSGHAGLFSTASDILKFSRALLNSLGGEGFFAPEILQEFLTFRVDEDQALGFARFTSIPEGFGHTGFPGVAFAFFPDRACAIVMMTNRLMCSGTPIATRPTFENHIKSFLRS